MAFSFTVNRPKDLKKTLENVKNLVEKTQDVVFEGNEHSGKITADGIKGTYIVKDSSVEVTVYEKPWHYADVLIKNRIKKVFSECSE